MFRKLNACNLFVTEIELVYHDYQLKIWHGNVYEVFARF